MATTRSRVILRNEWACPFIRGRGRAVPSGKVGSYEDGVAGEVSDHCDGHQSGGGQFCQVSQYWPETGILSFGPFNVTITGQQILADYATRRFLVQV